MNKMKNFIGKTSATMTIAVSSLYFGPVTVMARDLMNTTIGSNGQLEIPGNGATGTTDTLNNIMGVVKDLVVGFTAIGTVVLVGLFTWKAFTFAKDSQNPNARAANIQSMIGFAIGAALFGAAGLFTSLFYGLLQ